MITTKEDAKPLGENIEDVEEKTWKAFSIEDKVDILKTRLEYIEETIDMLHEVFNPKQ